MHHKMLLDLSALRLLSKIYLVTDICIIIPMFLSHSSTFLVTETLVTKSLRRRSLFCHNAAS